jgi:AcrR family transcriptional regulator
MNIHSVVQERRKMAGKDTRKKETPEKRREQILKAALDVFIENGYDAATMPEIAKAAGVAAGTIYLYFPSKRELFVAVIKDFVITPPLLNLIDGIPKGNVEDIFRSVLKDRFDLMKNPAFARMPLLISEVQRDPELKELWLKEFLRPFLARVQMGCMMMKAGNIIRDLQPEVAVRVIGGTILGFLLLRVIEGETSPLNNLDEAKIANDIATIILHGLLKTPEGAK